MILQFANLPLKIKLAVISFPLIIIVVIAIGAWQSIQKTTNPIAIYKVPATAKLYINNREVAGDRTKLDYGSYDIRVEADGFTTDTSTIVVNEDTTYIASALLPESDEAQKWADSNQQEYLDLESLVYKEEQEVGARFSSKNPIVTSLPIDNYSSKIGYKIDQSDSSGRSIILTVYGVDGFRNGAIKSIINAGYDPAEYKYEIEDDYNNPFEVDNE